MRLSLSVGLASAAFLMLNVLNVAASGETPAVCQSGMFTEDDDVQLFRFTLTTASVLTAQTWGYGGGRNACGQDIPTGGFDPILTLFDANGEQLAFNDDRSGKVDLSPGQGFDSFIQLLLPPGQYTLALTQFDNFAKGPNISDGFREGGFPVFTAMLGCSNGQFCDVTQGNRTADWAVDILLTPPCSECNAEPVLLADKSGKHSLVSPVIHFHQRLLDQAVCCRPSRNPPLSRRMSEGDVVSPRGGMQIAKSVKAQISAGPLRSLWAAEPICETGEPIWENDER